MWTSLLLLPTLSLLTTYFVTCITYVNGCVVAIVCMNNLQVVTPGPVHSVLSNGSLLWVKASFVIISDCFSFSVFGNWIYFLFFWWYFRKKGNSIRVHFDLSGVFTYIYKLGILPSLIFSSGLFEYTSFTVLFFPRPLFCLSTLYPSLFALYPTLPSLWYIPQAYPTQPFLASSVVSLNSSPRPLGFCFLRLYATRVFFFSFVR